MSSSLPISKEIKNIFLVIIRSLLSSNYIKEKENEKQII